MICIADMTHFIQRIFNCFFESDRTCCFTVEKWGNHKNNFFLNILLEGDIEVDEKNIWWQQFVTNVRVRLPFVGCNIHRIHQGLLDRSTLSFELNWSELDLLTAWNCLTNHNCYRKEILVLPIQTLLQLFQRQAGDCQYPVQLLQVELLEFEIG